MADVNGDLVPVQQTLMPYIIDDEETNLKGSIFSPEERRNWQLIWEELYYDDVTEVSADRTYWKHLCKPLKLNSKKVRKWVLDVYKSVNINERYKFNDLDIVSTEDWFKEMVIEADMNEGYVDNKYDIDVEVEEVRPEPSLVINDEPVPDEDEDMVRYYEDLYGDKDSDEEVEEYDTAYDETEEDEEDEDYEVDIEQLLEEL